MHLSFVKSLIFILCELFFSFILNLLNRTQVFKMKPFCDFCGFVKFNNFIEKIDHLNINAILNKSDTNFDFRNHLKHIQILKYKQYKFTTKNINTKKLK